MLRNLFSNSLFIKTLYRWFIKARMTSQSHLDPIVIFSQSLIRAHAHIVSWRTVTEILMYFYSSTHAVRTNTLLFILMSHVCKSQLIYMLFSSRLIIFCINFIYDYSVQFVCWNTWWLTYQPLLGEHSVAIQKGSLQVMNVRGRPGQSFTTSLCRGRYKTFQNLFNIV